MLHEDPGNVSYSAVGGLSDQIRELRESIELPLMNPELFVRVGIKPPKVHIILYYINHSNFLVYINLTKSRFHIFSGILQMYWLCLGCSSVWTSWNWEDLTS